MVDRMKIAHQMVEIMPLLMRNMASQMRCHGGGLVPAHLRLLGMLSRRTYNLTELAEMQSVTLATMSNSVAILVERGLAERHPAANDRRVVQVCLTAHGNAVLEHITRAMEERFAGRLEDLAEEDLQALENGLAVLTQVLVDENPQAAACEEIDA
ncbi:MAG TPA: MarR family transcriptional regulator [Anaerolineaceae bacterium]